MVILTKKMFTGKNNVEQLVRKYKTRQNNLRYNYFEKGIVC